MPSENLYETLGIDRDASPEEVRKAYRRKAKKAHPDAGGDPETFHAISRALRILDDPAKRAKYDAGEDPDDGADNARAKLLDRVFKLFSVVFDHIDADGGDPAQCDIVEMATRVAEGTIADKVKARGRLEREAEKWEKRKGRFAGPEAVVSILEGMLDQPIRMARDGIQNMNKLIEQDREVLAFLQDVRWRRDPAPMRNPYSAREASINSEMLAAMQAMARRGL